MFRKILLRRSLKKLALLLINRYGVKEYYSIGQLDTTIKKYKINLKDYNYFQLLFLSKSDYKSITGKSNYIDHRKSLYLYLNNNIADLYINKNNFVRLLNIDNNKFDNCHTPIKPNPNINGFTR